MTRWQLELALKQVAEKIGEKEFIIFGSQAILGTVPNPPDACLVSQEIDLYPKHFYQAVPVVVTEFGRRSEFAQRNDFMVDCVSPDLATFPDGWTERLVPFQSENTGGAIGWCVELHDISVSKLIAGREKDFTYVQALINSKLIKRGVLENRAEHRAAIDSKRNTSLARSSRL